MELNDLERKTILITGATGLIGQAIIKKLKNSSLNINVVDMVRDKKKAERILGKETAYYHYLVTDILSLTPRNFGVNYIIHGASITSSKDFVEKPVETIVTALEGTRNLLEFARENPVESFVYLSSMEVYGAPSTDKKIDENSNTNLNTTEVRACYPESKRMCENLCVSYATEYKIPAKIVRLTQTFGAGVQYNDGRVFAEFARCVLENRNIILHTKGETKRSYLHTYDAADAILTVLLKGRIGEAYNAANENTYCSIYEMATMVAKVCSHNKIEVVVENEKDMEKFGYAPVLHMNLDSSKLQALGWKAQYNLQDMYEDMIDDLRISK